jgi:hypothetical protein
LRSTSVGVASGAFSSNRSRVQAGFEHAEQEARNVQLRRRLVIKR